MEEVVSHVLLLLLQTLTFCIVATGCISFGNQCGLFLVCCIANSEQQLLSVLLCNQKFQCARGLNQKQVMCNAPCQVFSQISSVQSNSICFVGVVQLYGGHPILSGWSVVVVYSHEPTVCKFSALYICYSDLAVRVYVITTDLQKTKAPSQSHQSAKYLHLTLSYAISGLFLPAVVRPILDSYATEEQVAPTPLKDVCGSPQILFLFLSCDFIKKCYYDLVLCIFQPRYLSHFPICHGVCQPRYYDQVLSIFQPWSLQMKLFIYLITPSYWPQNPSYTKGSFGTRNFSDSDWNWAIFYEIPR